MMPVEDVELSGSDYFLFAMDHTMRTAGLPESPCRMVVELQGYMDPEILHEAVNNTPFLMWLANVSKKQKFPFALPKWRSNGYGKQLSITSEGVDRSYFGKNGFFLNFPRNREKCDFRPPLSFSLVKPDENSSSCIATWDHALMDAHGAEVLLQHVARYPELAAPGRMLPTKGQIIESRLDPSHGFVRRLSYARKSINYISKASDMPIAVLKPKERRVEHVDQYYTIRFDVGETERIIGRCEGMGMSCYHSLFYLAATIRAVHAVRLCRGEDPFPYLVPVPLNLRRKGGVGPAFSNNVSFLFYRVTPGETADFKMTVASLKDQMKEQIVQEIPYSYVEMMKILRRLPLPLYSKLLSGPTQGRFASFFFSYTGECCSGMESFMGVKVKEVVHLAPATSIPGLSVVFMRHRNSLKAILSFRDSLLNQEELALFEGQLRKDLLSEHV